MNFINFFRDAADSVGEDVVGSGHAHLASVYSIETLPGS